MVSSKGADTMMQFPAIEGEFNVEPQKQPIESLRFGGSTGEFKRASTHLPTFPIAAKL
jgi:hypothetical protein